MRISQYLPCILLLATSCRTPARNPPSADLKSVDTPNTISHPETREKKPGFTLKTHLKDTTYASGNFILFLRPDGARYDELENEGEDEVGDGDADFGVGISGTQDSVKKNERYKDIHVLVSTSRFICIRDCKDGPLVIDRDSVSYGFILSANGRPATTTFNEVHSGNYIGEIDDYFFPR